MFGFLKNKLKEIFHKPEKEVEKEETEEKETLVETLEEKKEKTKSVELTEKISQPELIEEETPITANDKKEYEQKETQPKSEGLFSKLKKLISNQKINDEDFDEFFNELELILIENNVAIEAIDNIKENLKKDTINKEIKKGKIKEEIENSLKKAIDNLMIQPFDLIEKIKEKKNEIKEPFVILFLGINGSGKTTSIAKVANMLKNNNLSVILGAADTFRAASIEQLEKHGNNLNLKVIKQNYGSDPAAVAFDSIAYAKSHNIDVVLIDTAGRMHTKTDLIREMEKIVRVSKPDLKIFVAESITGNDAVEQAKVFNEAVNIDGIILTKADVDERGGTCISVSYVTGKPILFLGVGQEYKDLEKFNKEKIIESIFE